MEMKLKEKEAFTVVGMEYRGQNAQNEIPELWGKFMPRVPEIKHVVDRQFCFGAEDNYDEATGEFDYLACVAVSQVVDLPSGMKQWHIPANTYAVFPCTLPTIRETYDSISQSGLADAGLQRLPDPEFELYDETFNPQDPNSVLYLYIPVEK